MKLSKEFIVHSTGVDTLLVPTGAAEFHGWVQGNKTVEFILNSLLSDTTEDEIVNAMREKFDGDIADMKADVADVVAKLRKVGAIEE